MTKKTRILHVIPNFGPGGAERLLVNLLEAFDHARFEVEAVSLYPESGTILEKEIGEKRFKVHFLNKHRGLDLRMFPQLCRLFRGFRPHVVHTHRYALRYTLLPALLRRVPLQIHTVHSVAQKEVDRFGRLVQQIAFRSSQVIPVSISSQVSSTVRALYGYGVHTPVIYNGIPIAEFVFAQEKNGAGSERHVVLLNVGRFAAPKNHLLLIQAFALAVKDYPAMQLRLVGDGGLRPVVEKSVAEMGLEEKVLFLGMRDDVPGLLAGSDLFVLSSDYEGVPLAVLEAMATGKPVVSTAVGGIPELVEEGITGCLVPPRDPQALAQRILHLAGDPLLRQCMGKAARERALRRFDIARTAREYEALYLELLKKRVKP